MSGLIGVTAYSLVFLCSDRDNCLWNIPILDVVYILFVLGWTIYVQRLCSDAIDDGRVILVEIKLSFAKISVKLNILCHEVRTICVENFKRCCVLSKDKLC